MNIIKPEDLRPGSPERPKNASFFPLRSNAAWFAGEATVAALEKRIKLALICFDAIVLQDGGYELVVTANGSMNRFFLAGTMPLDERKLFFGQGGNFKLQVISKVY